MFLLSIGRVEEVLSLVPWVAWDGETRFRADADPAYHAALLRKVRIALKTKGIREDVSVAPYRMSRVNNAKRNLCVLAFLFALCVLMWVTFLPSGSAASDRYYWFFIFFSVAGMALASAAIRIYWRHRAQIRAHWSIKALECLTYLLGTSVPPRYDEMDRALDVLLRISPSAFMHDNALYRMDKAYCLAQARRFADALEIVAAIDKRWLEECSSEEIEAGYEGYISPISGSSSEQLVPRDVEMFALSLRICSEMPGHELPGQSA